jgi:hypothetical protein
MVRRQVREAGRRVGSQRRKSGSQRGRIGLGGQVGSDGRQGGKIGR